MISRTRSVLVALMPAVAVANALASENSEIEQAAFETWSVEQLCGARDNAEALEELDRREVFDGRELRAIRRDLVRERISEEALRCTKGSPERILSAITTVDGDPVDAFVYPPGTIDSLIVFLRRAGDVSTVVAFTESADPYMFPSWGSEIDFCSAPQPSFLPRGDSCFARTQGYAWHKQLYQSMTPMSTVLPPPPQSLPSQ